MGYHLQSCELLRQKNRKTSAFFVFLLILTSTRARFMPQDGSNFKLIDTHTKMGMKEEYSKMIERRSVLIGSRPPRCDRKFCENCGQCEAIQVPIVPRLKSTIPQAFGTTPRSIVDSRGDDFSNYKPMCWKCKCGNLVFNP